MASACLQSFFWFSEKVNKIFYELLLVQYKLGILIKKKNILWPQLVLWVSSQYLSPEDVHEGFFL